MLFNLVNLVSIHCIICTNPVAMRSRFQHDTAIFLATVGSKWNFRFFSVACVIKEQISVELKSLVLA